MVEDQIFSEPAEVDAVDGAVIIKCPASAGVRMTPAAAEETSERLFEGALKARGQRYFTDDSRD